MQDGQLRTGAQRSAFDEWVDAMRAWQREIDVTPDADVVLTTRFSDLLEPEIRYGRYAGERRWEDPADIPAPRIKDELLQLIVWQGDSEVRAVEQARELLDHARGARVARAPRDQGRGVARDVQRQAELGRCVLVAQLG
jgi:hypothetical protein